MVTRLCIEVGKIEEHVHSLWYKQGPDTHSEGRYIERVLFLDGKRLSQSNEWGRVKLEVGVKGRGGSGGYSLLALIIQEGAFWEVQLPC